jgi:LysM repeat protein
MQELTPRQDRDLGVISDTSTCDAMANAATFGRRRNLRNSEKGDRMLKSGNGRHRKPRQASTAMVAVAATGAGMALPLFAASGAQAADSTATDTAKVSTTVWNAVALCESGGVWSSNTGNGFFGGLQIVQESWDNYGGDEYAARPDLASQNEQISVAETMLDELGPDAWPTCADSSGLLAALGLGDTADEPSDTATDTATDTPTDDATDGTTDSATDDAASSSPSSTTSGDSGESASPSASTSPSASARNQGRHAKPDGTGTSGSSAATGATQQVAQARAAWGELTRTTVTTKSATSTADGKRYRVEEGDTLCDIAAEEHVAGGWRALYEANKAVIGDDPSAIHSGQYLTVG